jgi:hypothetical protein
LPYYEEKTAEKNFYREGENREKMICFFPYRRSLPFPAAGPLFVLRAFTANFLNSVCAFFVFFGGSCPGTEVSGQL